MNSKQLRILFKKYSSNNVSMKLSLIYKNLLDTISVS